MKSTAISFDISTACGHFNVIPVRLRDKLNSVGCKKQNTSSASKRRFRLSFYGGSAGQITMEVHVLTPNDIKAKAFACLALVPEV